MSRDTSFYYSFLVLPPRKRRALIAVWDFCRAVDDAVDEVVPEEEWRGGLSEEARARAADRLAVWKTELDACFDRRAEALRLPADGLPADELPANRVPADRVQADRSAADRLPADGLSANRLPTDRVPTDRLPTDRLPADTSPADRLPADQFGALPRTPQGRALRPLIAEFNLPRGPFDELIAGVGMDLDHARYPTFAALETYCRRVASTVGLICVEIFGYRDPRAQSYAVNLGLALQITNIVRDVAADLRCGRVYLPAEDLDRFGVTEQMLAEGRTTPPVRALLRFECERARHYYGRAAAELPPVDARSLVAAEIMGGIYFEILRRIERSGYDVFSRRIRVPRPQRALIALRTWLRTELLGSRRRSPRATAKREP